MHNYKELKFMCGIEIHQQLEGKKLFCNCPATIKKENPDYEIKRRLRASAGESGNVDRAAEYEMKKSKEFQYQAYKDCTCLVETDEEPPHTPNQEALISAITVAKMLNMKIVDIIQFMRKTVIDGSNVSGFQRTALIGYDGYIIINNKKIGIDTLCLEEEAAQNITRTKEKDEYNLSRLGIPLLEIATAPDITTPEECRETAAQIGMILRSLPNCKRGIGSIRQDVNISIKGGNRVELKGFQDIRKIPQVINNEIQRHLEIINKGKKLEKEVRKVEPDNTTTFLRPMPGADRMYPETDIETIPTKNIKYEIPETLEEKTQRYKKKFSLSEDLAQNIVKQESKTNNDFEEIFIEFISKNLTSNNIADIYLSKIPDTEKKTNKKIKPELIKKILAEISSGRIPFSALPELLQEATNEKINFSKYESMSEEEIKKIIKKIKQENPQAPQGLIMGKIMSETKGRADGKKVKELLELTK